MYPLYQEYGHDIFTKCTWIDYTGRFFHNESGQRYCVLQIKFWVDGCSFAYARSASGRRPKWNPLIKRHCRISIDLKVRFHLHQPFSRKKRKKHVEKTRNAVESCWTYAVQINSSYKSTLCKNLIKYHGLTSEMWFALVSLNTTTWEFSFQLNTCHIIPPQHQKQTKALSERTPNHLGPLANKKEAPFIFHSLLSYFLEKVAPKNPQNDPMVLSLNKPLRNSSKLTLQF